MRRNMPVTNVEYVLKDTETIVSKTDLKGKITYINQDFIAISGFSADELIGAPQNIVRHPDMPPEAFADFWRTLKSGKAWTGLVKNRCKNGDHYWVEANAAPLYEHGVLAGYTSIRVKPSREQVAAAEEAYRRIANGDTSIEIVEGKAVPRSSWRSLRRRAALPVAARMFVVAAVLAAICIASALLAGFGHATAASWLSCIGAACAFGGAFLQRAWAVAPLQRIRAEIGKVSAGDLSARIDADGQDEMAALSQALRVLQTNVKVLIGQIKEATMVVNSGTTEIAEGNVRLSARTEAAASALEETAASMEELTATVRNNAANAQQAHTLVGAAAGAARDGGAAVHQAVDTMRLIEDSSRKIVDIISVIDGIAFQTNILALNAAVEAARAGEQGRGFAVVAGEVRTLAQRSATAAREIKELIGDSVRRVHEGARQVDDAGNTIDGVVDQVHRVSNYMNEITAASREQTAGIEQVNKAIIEMDQATQQNSRLVEEATRASNEMRLQAAELARLVNGFRLLPHAAHAAQVVRLDAAGGQPPQRRQLARKAA